MSETISVFLTTSQKNKMNSGKTFQLSASALQASTGKHPVDIEMSTKNYKTLVNNVSKNKGYRFTADKIVGSGFFKDIAKTVGKKVAKTVAEKSLDYIGEKTGQQKVTNALKGSVDGLVDVAAERVGGKMKKGSPEMAAHMARLRSMRKGKGVQEIEGGNVFDDIKNGWNKTFNPKLGRKIKDAFTSKPAREVYKGLANAGLRIGSSFTGLPLSLAQGEIDRQIDGASIKRRSNIMVKGGTLVSGVPVVQIRGKGFTGVDGTKFGGSFLSPQSRGGSFYSP
jgi:ribosomal protein S7